MGDPYDSEQMARIREMKARLDGLIEQIIRGLYARKSSCPQPPEVMWYAEGALEIYKKQQDFVHELIYAFGCGQQTVEMSNALNDQLELIKTFVVPLLGNE